MQSTFGTVTSNAAIGGRLGLWWPEVGIATGISGLYNPDYIAGSHNAIHVLAVDFNYHKGNWDFRAEGGMLNQQTDPFLSDNITREGLSAQIAYRPRNAPNRYLQNLELVYRYSYVCFKGIDPTTLDLTTFSTPTDVPVRRQQNEVGLNYYFYPRMILKGAYQINDEPGFHLHDNQFLCELAWGF
jgi:hypothetical protein